MRCSLSWRGIPPVSRQSRPGKAGLRRMRAGDDFRIGLCCGRWYAGRVPCSGSTFVRRRGAGPARRPHPGTPRVGRTVPPCCTPTIGCLVTTARSPDPSDRQQARQPTRLRRELRAGLWPPREARQDTGDHGGCDQDRDLTAKEEGRSRGARQGRARAAGEHRPGRSRQLQGSRPPARHHPDSSAEWEPFITHEWEPNTGKEWEPSCSTTIARTKSDRGDRVAGGGERWHCWYWCATASRGGTARTLHRVDRRAAHRDGSAKWRALPSCCIDVRFDGAYTSVLQRANETSRSSVQYRPDGYPVKDQYHVNATTATRKGQRGRDGEEFGDEQVHIWRRSYDVAPPGGELAGHRRAHAAVPSASAAWRRQEHPRRARNSLRRSSCTSTA